MIKTHLTVLLLALPLLLLGQVEVNDTSPDIGEYFITNVEDIPYDRALLDTIQGFNIAIIPPEHFIFAENIPGFIHPGTSASMQIKEIEGTSWPIIDKVMTPEHFESQGVEFLSRQEVELKSGISGVIYTVRFESKGIRFQRLMLFAGDYNQTIWINVNYPEMLRKTILKPIMSSLMSAELI